MFVLSRDDTYNIEKDIQNIYCISEEILMENAGLSLFNYIKNIANINSKILILSGPGNNGGDGFVLMRHLKANNYNVDLYYPLNNNKYTGASKKNFNILTALNIDLYDLSLINDMIEYDIIVDALFGIGLNKEITGIYKKIIDIANNTNAIKISVDIPSGLICDSSKVPDCVFNADYTVTFSTLKYCHILYPAKKYVGVVKVANISIPSDIIQKYNYNVLINENNKPKFLNRIVDGHKGTFGKVAIVGGSYEMAGAVKIASISALHSGCGLISVCHPSILNRNFISDIPEVMVKPFEYNKPEEIVKFINNFATVYTIGNGMGKGEIIKEFILYILANADRPVVVDADAINSITLNDLEKIKNKAIITPHLVEFARLINKDIKEVIDNKILLANQFVSKYNVCLVLKSADTVIAVPDDKIYILNKGNTSLSKGGTGDALCGLIASLLAQGYNMKDACILASYIIGKSAEKAVEKFNPACLSITDIISYYNEVFNEA